MEAETDDRRSLWNLTQGQECVRIRIQSAS